ncbi:MAG: hypothetical protein QOI41_707 [Myxococcales bacterium]|nr:hypothetical protein [Myxococcales bacterium]
MKNLRALALLAPVLFVPLACENSSSPSASFVPEAGPGFEAGPSPEAGPVPDAGDDGPVTPPAPKGVTITVTEDGAVKADVRVLGHDATGTVNGDKKTDATGKVFFALAPSMVTVLNGGKVNVAPVTYLGVADGDKLVVAIKTSALAPDQVPYAQITASFAADPISTKGNGFFVRVGGGCTGSASLVDVPVNVDLYPYCLGTKNALLTTVTNNGNLTEYGFAKDIAVTMGAKVNVGPLAGAVPGATKVTASHLPSSQTTSRFAQLGAIANGAVFDVGNASGTLDTGDLTFPTATGFAEAYQPAVSISQFGNFSSTKAFVRREPTTAPVSATLADFDFATALPFIQTGTVVTSTPARPDVTFTSEAPLTVADGGIATLGWFINSTDGNGTWTFVLPPSATGFTVPALPADASLFGPVGTVTLRDVTFVESNLLPGYSELKLLPIQPAVGVDFIDTSKPLPVAGTVKVTRFSGQLR